MKQIVVEIPESKYEFFDELMAQLGFAQKNKNSDELVYASVKQGLREVNLIRAGKLQKKPIQKLLREI
jgi:hypothetical protein